MAASIRRDPAGKRDYALLATLLQKPGAGCRFQEVADIIAAPATVND